ncbi:MAG: hypothetical protein M3R02_11250 [Chloroflexota bacterium]|nr:hypothetical protein [Chloroflexota bacterium]
MGVRAWMVGVVLVGVVAAAVVGWQLATRAQNVTPLTSPPALASPTAVEAASQSYEAVGDAIVAVTGVDLFAFQVGLFADENAAIAAFRGAADPTTAGRVGLNGKPRVVSAPSFSNESAALIGRMTDGGSVVRLIVRDGRYLHVWAASGGDTGAALLTLISVADQVFVQPDGTPVAEPLLQGRLPRLDQLPPGYVVYDQYRPAYSPRLRRRSARRGTYRGRHGLKNVHGGRHVGAQHTPPRLSRRRRCPVLLVPSTTLVQVWSITWPNSAPGRNFGAMQSGASSWPTCHARAATTMS